MKTRVLPSGKFLHFNVEKHTYTVASTSAAVSSHVSNTEENNGILCSSVSAVLDKCFPFDGEAVATKVARKSPFDVPLVQGEEGYGKEGIDGEGKAIAVYRQKSPKEIMAEWASRASLGSNVHAFIEQKILNQPLSPRMECQGEEHLYYPVADYASSEVLKHYDPVEIELMVASPSLKLAGTIDFLGRNKKTGGLLVGDWKTSSSSFSEFKHSSFDTPASSDADMGFLVNEKSRRYALQVLIYGYLLQKEGYLAKYNQPLLLHNSSSGSKSAAVNTPKKTTRTNIDKNGKDEISYPLQYLPLEYGIIQMSKKLDGTVGVQFKKVTPSNIIPIDMIDDVTSDDVIRSLIGS